MRSTHFLESAEGEKVHDMERRGMREGHSLTGGHGGRGQSGYEGAQVRASEGTHILSRTEGGTSQEDGRKREDGTHKLECTGGRTSQNTESERGEQHSHSRERRGKDKG